MRIYLQTVPSAEKTPRFYHIHLEPDLFKGWMLTREWGSQGRSSKMQMEHYSDIGTAEDALEKIRDLQIKRGYKIVFTEGQIRP